MSHDDMNFEQNHEFTELAQALRENRPTPEPEFTDRLDRIVSDHFPSEWTEEVSVGRSGKRVGGFWENVRRRLDGSRAILPTLAGAVGVLFVLAVVVTGTTNGPSGSSDSSSTSDVAQSQSSAGDSAASGSATTDEVQAGALSPTEKSYIRSGIRLGPESYAGNGTSAGAFKSMLDSAQLNGAQRTSANRDVAREAEITLGTDPSGVQDVANEIVAVTDDHNGIVMDSKVVDGKKGTAGATFSLLIPSGQIESAVADLSEVADLRSRSQELTDITAPTNKAEDDIADSEAKIKSLLGELETTYDEDERASLEQQIRWERNDKRWAETRLNRLERRADYTPVGLRVETGGDTSSDDESSGWGFSDAIDDAGKMLGVAAGVTVIALAIAIPIGIVILIALAMNRAWVRRSRRRALADDA